jgi:hypothetical protein
LSDGIGKEFASLLNRQAMRPTRSMARAQITPLHSTSPGLVS